MPEDPNPSTEQQAQPNTGDTTGQQGGNAPGNGGQGDDKKFTQAELDAIVKDRLDRERQKRERDDQTAKAKADETRLKEQEKFQELADQRQKRIDELEPISAKLEEAEGALTKLLEQERKDLPAHITSLLDGLSPAKQLTWIAENREAISKAEGGTETVRGVPPTPKANGKTPNRDETIKEKADALRRSGAYAPF